MIEEAFIKSMPHSTQHKIMTFIKKPQKLKHHKFDNINFTDLWAGKSHKQDSLMHISTLLKQET